MEDFSQNIELSEKTSKKKIFVLIGLFISIFIFGLILILATRIWDPLWNPFRPKPERVINLMSEKMEKLRTFQRKMEINIMGSFSLLSQEETKINFKLINESKNDLSQKENPKIESNFDLAISFERKESPNIELNFSGKGIVFGKENYLKFETFPSFPFFGLKDIDFSSIKDVWIKTDRDFFSNLKNFGGVEKEEKRENTFFEKIQEKLNEKLKEKKIYQIKKELPDEKIGKIRTYHYLLNLNKEEILNLVLEIQKEMMNELKTNDLEKGIMDKIFNEEELKKRIKEFLDKIGEIEIEYWIGKKDLLLYQLKGKTKGEGIAINFSIQYSNFDQPFKIEVPSEYKSLEEILTSFFEKFFKGYKESGPFQYIEPDETIIANLRGAKIVAEWLFKDEKSYKNLCLNFALNKKHPFYGENLLFLEEDIKKNQGGKLNFVCLSSIQSYCLVADLISPDKGKYCIDSSGVEKEISQESSCIGSGISANPYRCP